MEYCLTTAYCLNCFTTWYRKMLAYAARGLANDAAPGQCAWPPPVSQGFLIIQSSAPKVLPECEFFRIYLTKFFYNFGFPAYVRLFQLIKVWQKESRCQSPEHRYSIDFTPWQLAQWTLPEIWGRTDEIALTG